LKRKNRNAGIKIKEFNTLLFSLLFAVALLTAVYLKTRGSGGAGEKIERLSAKNSVIQVEVNTKGGR
jgi:hypothetical protein